MKKLCVLLCLVAVSFSMAACGNSDIQAQAPVDQAETSQEERAPLSEVSEESENENVASGNVNSMETETEGMSESDFTDREESMTEPAVDAGETETVPGTTGAETVPETEMTGVA